MAKNIYKFIHYLSGHIYYHYEGIFYRCRKCRVCSKKQYRKDTVLGEYEWEDL